MNLLNIHYIIRSNITFKNLHIIQQTINKSPIRIFIFLIKIIQMLLKITQKLKNYIPQIIFIIIKLHQKIIQRNKNLLQII